MHWFRMRKTVIVVAATTLVASLVFDADAAEHGDQEPRNIIFLLGDGMSRAHVTAGRQRYYGARGRLNMEQLPYLGSVSTYAVEPVSDQPVLVTDSSSAATAWSSGVKTYNAGVGVDAEGYAVPTLMEQAKSAGFATGNVTTAEVTDATPAAMYSHTWLRMCQGPDFTEASCVVRRPDGSYSPLPEDKTVVTPIAEQVARRHTADVILGGGLARFEPEDEKALRDGGYEVLGSFGDPVLAEQTAASQRAATKADLDAVKGGKVIGLFNRGNLTLEATSPPQRQEPTLAEMTRKSLSLLSGRRNTKGFFLQVEGAQIDKRSHANDANQTLAEVKAFDDAVAAAVDFAKRDRKTLVIVTSDHECAGFNIIEHRSFTNAEAAAPPGNTDSSNPANNGVPVREPSAHRKDPNRSTGIVNAPGSANAANFGPATFRTPDDPADVTDGSERASLWLAYLSGGHTGADVPIYAFGPGGQQYAKSQDNTDLYKKMRRALLGSR
ncbi:alkaline phosphatase [Lentzea flaviverrucosa]|uniref:Alkaline phosphatase n=1 Tax=Lentzea flaviverrucosa TaxID=200379 RepID=A0A1H9WTG0_9PSEU|nr:alkaline phosphatase [Lentzea flaviverrucosa]RDI23089.1 alkaline phosphatase [Lentzea flaviverrucosa]SES37216.1 alkaline phosphatase [Lentzea flaviverrucosa]